MELYRTATFHMILKSTSAGADDVASTSVRRHFDAMCLLGSANTDIFILGDCLLSFFPQL